MCLTFFAMPTAKHEGVKEEKLSKNAGNTQGNGKDNKKETKTTIKPQQGTTSKSDDSDKTQPHPSTPLPPTTTTTTSTITITTGGNTSTLCSASSSEPCCEKSDEGDGGGGGGRGNSGRNEKDKNERTNQINSSKFPTTSNNNSKSKTNTTITAPSTSHKQQHHLTSQQTTTPTTTTTTSSSSSSSPSPRSSFSNNNNNVNTTNNNSANNNNNNERSNCTKLFCGSGSGSSESKRKDVDENNVNGSSSGNCDTGSKWRKSSRKGSKKKDKNALKEEPSKLGVTSDSVSGNSGDSNIQSGTCVNSANNNNNNNNSIENGGTTPPTSTTTTTNQQSQQQSGAHDRKSCCFCWCCCCSCSCLPGKNQNKTGKENTRIQPSTSLEHYFNGNSDPPSIEEMRLWSESFDKLMKCPWGRKVFRDFLKCEYSEENILFWLACEDLKNESNPEVIEEKARIIYEDYISILSPKEVSLDSRVREIINKNMVNPSPHTFDEAQLQIYTLMHRDSYPRFINSNMYRKLAQLPTSSRKGSTA
ncbi:uncharacterized protein DDB_G0271670-like isoform X2 [Panonychus citri]|uniref:uncharacterized protein DDB_G0271670-like isoform X2 n=1 Tax=Panonychus citri TaxID=50023 RepID=UPI00230789B6|nr:uncharacterized protein DDB_G0271670-like isoform X2 [Panonychus citri]